MANPDYSISPYGRANCPVCGGEYSLTKSGKLRAHDDKRTPTHLPFHPRCAGAGKAPGQAPAAPVVALAPTVAGPALSSEERRRRLEADIADAKKTLNRAQWHFDSLCNELAALRREEMEAPAPATDPLAVTLDETHLWAVARLAPGQALTVTAPPCVADVIGKEDRPWVIVTFDDFGVRPTFIRTRQFVAAHFTGPFAVELDAAAKEIDADPTGPQVARVVFEPRGTKRKPTWHAIGHELINQNTGA